MTPKREHPARRARHTWNSENVIVLVLSVSNCEKSSAITTSISAKNSESDGPFSTACSLVTNFLLPLEDVKLDKDEGE